MLGGRARYVPTSAWWLRSCAIFLLVAFAAAEGDSMRLGAAGAAEFQEVPDAPAEASDSSGWRRLAAARMLSLDVPLFPLPSDLPALDWVVRVVGTPTGNYSLAFQPDWPPDGNVCIFCWSLRANQVARNARINGSWGVEELGGGNPFTAGVRFELRFQFAATAWQVWINGVRRSEFDFVHRNASMKPRALQVTGLSDPQVEIMGYRNTQSSRAQCTLSCGTAGYLYYSGYSTPAPRTVEAWVRIDGGTGTPFLGNGYTTDKAWGLYFGTNTLYSAETGGPAWPYSNGAGVPNPTDGKWHHVALAGSAFFVDGVQMLNSVNNYLLRSSTLWIGNWPNRFPYGQGGNIYFRDVRVWSVARTAADIRGSMDAVSNNATGLMTRLLFEQSMNDSSPVRRPWTASGVSYACDAPVWTRFAKCNGASSVDRLDFSAATVMSMAPTATRVRVCTAGNSSDCATSVAGSFPIKMLAKGSVVNMVDGYACNLSCAASTWAGPRSASMWSSCAGASAASGALEGKTNLFWSCGTTEGLHLSVKDGGICGWTNTRNDSLEVFFDATVPYQEFMVVPFATLPSNTSGDVAVRDLATAKVACTYMGSSCGGVTCVDGLGLSCTLRGTVDTVADAAAYSYVKTYPVFVSSTVSSTTSSTSKTTTSSTTTLTTSTRTVSSTTTTSTTRTTSSSSITSSSSTTSSTSTSSSTTTSKTTTSSSTTLTTPSSSSNATNMTVNVSSSTSFTSTSSSTLTSITTTLSSTTLTTSSSVSTSNTTTNVSSDTLSTLTSSSTTSSSTTTWSSTTFTTSSSPNAGNTTTEVSDSTSSTSTSSSTLTSITTTLSSTTFTTSSSVSASNTTTNVSSDTPSTSASSSTTSSSTTTLSSTTFTTSSSPNADNTTANVSDGTSSTSTSSSTLTSITATSSTSASSSTTSSSTTTTSSRILTTSSSSSTSMTTSGSSTTSSTSAASSRTSSSTTSSTSTSSSTLMPITSSSTSTSTSIRTTASSTTFTTSSSSSTTSTATITTSSTTSSSSSTSTFTPPAAVELVPLLPPCEDEDTFRDYKGLGCDDWRGLNCSAHPEGYDNASVEELLRSCPVACGLCAGASKPGVVFEKRRAVSVGLQIGVDLSYLLGPAREAAVAASFAAALNVSVAFITSVTIEEVVGRRLQSRLPAYNVRCEAVVPPSAQVRSVILQATTLATSGASSFVAFEASLAAAGVDTSSLRIEVAEQPVATTVKVALYSDGSITTVKESAAPAPADGAGAPAPQPTTGSVALLAVGCEDKQEFVDEQGEGCSGWVGYECDSPHWLSTEKKYSVKGLLAVQTNCPLSCGLCTPPGRARPAELLASCADDAYIGGWCLRWRGMNCSSATSLGYSADYQQLLLSRCPLSCGRCGNATLALVDIPGFQDELGNNCSTWVGVDCTKMYTGYSRKGLLMVQAACQQSCFGNSSRGSAAATCEDDSDFSLLQQYRCQDFIGRVCTYATLYLESRWLLGPRGALAWHEQLWSHCPVACGMCNPPGRPTVSDLAIECQDDPYTESWCAYRWQRRDCLHWNQTLNLVVQGEPERFNATLLGRCPSACQLCTPPVCLAGTFRDTRRHLCAACPLGTYMPTAASGPAAQSCLVAQRGFAVPRAGAVAEEPCGRGAYASSAGQAACDACAPGRYAGSRGMDVCLECEAGWFQEAAGASACRRCPTGSYASSRGATACTACPPGFSTLLEASTSDSRCSCPPGQWRPLNSRTCEDCPPGIFCPGGHGQFDTGPDLTAQLLPGMMSLPEEVDSVYSCAALEDTCPGYRPLPYSAELFAEVCPGNRHGPRCTRCPENSFLGDDGACQECGGANGIWASGLNIIVAWAAGIYATESCYRACQRYRNEGTLVFWSLVSFAQGLVPLIKIPLRWPRLFNVVFRIIIPFSMPGLWDLWSFNLQFKCLVGESYIWETVKNVALPLFNFVNVGMLWLIFPLTCRRVDKPLALCCIACLWDGTWIALCVLAVMFFPTDVMPNGKEFLRYSPAVELGTNAWRASLPLGVGAILLYVCSFLAYTIHGTVNAPRMYVQNGGYGDQYGYIVYLYRPEAYWWGLVLYASNFAYALIQLVGDVYSQIYITLFLLVAMGLVEFWVYPSQFLQFNRISVLMKGATTFFLVLSICFVDLQDPTMKEQARTIPQVLIGIGLAVAGIFLLTAAHSIGRGVGRRKWRAIHNQRMAGRARAVMSIVATMPEQNFIKCFKNFSDSDWEGMHEHIKMLAAVFLQMQSGRHWWTSRIIPNAQPGVYDWRRISFQAHELVSRRVVHMAIDKNADARKTFDRFQALVLRRPWEDLDPAAHPVAAAVAAALSDKALQRTLAAYMPPELRAQAPPRKAAAKEKGLSLAHMEEVLIHWPQFLSEFGGQGALSEAELRGLFQALDHQGTGEVPLARIVAIVLSHSPAPGRSGSGPEPGSDDAAGDLQERRTDSRSVTNDTDNGTWVIDGETYQVVSI